LKDGYTRCKSKRSRLLLKSGSSSSKLPTCQFFDQLQFLGDTYTNDPEQDMTNRDTSSSAASSSANSTNIHTPPYRESFKRHKPNKVDAVEREIISSLKAVNEQIQKPTDSTDKEDSPNLHFCNSLAPLMDDLSPEQIMIARIKIQQMLYEVKYNKTL